MNYGELDGLTRREIDDETGIETNDSRVSKAQMLAYANEAEAEACLRGRLLVDSSTEEICRINVVAGTALYDYDPRIILIRRVRMTGAANPLGKASHTIMDELRPGWEDHTGEVECLVTGMNTGKLMVYRKPSANGILNLSVVRRPLQEMTQKTDSPEINSLLHPALILWMKHKIYNNQNSELFDKNRSDIHLAMFEQKFGPRTAVAHDVFDEMQIPNHIFNDAKTDYQACEGYF